MRREELDPSTLTAIPVAIAAWCRYLLGVDDAGKPFTLSPDPVLADLQAKLQGTALGDKTSNIRAILENEQIFGVSLEEAGLTAKIEGIFHEMLAGPGAVRSTIAKYVEV
jgi:fructuronate reductase